MKPVKYLTMFLRNPFGWTFRIYPASKALSEFITAKLDAGHAPVIIDKHMMLLDGAEIWRENFPYAYGSLRIPSKEWDPENEKLLPSRRAAMRLREAELSVYGTAEQRLAKALADLGGAK